MCPRKGILELINTVECLCNNTLGTKVHVSGHCREVAITGGEG